MPESVSCRGRSVCASSSSGTNQVRSGWRYWPVKSRLGSSSSSSSRKLAAGRGRRVSTEGVGERDEEDGEEGEEEDDDGAKLTHRSRIDSPRGSGVSRNLRVVDGSGAMVLLSLLKLFRGVLLLLSGVWLEGGCIMKMPSSDEDSSSIATGHPSSSPLHSTAMHCSTSLLK